ncbi:MAG: hypothetical protein ACRDOK_04555 [Streptosporangiaceae bacterium]
MADAVLYEPETQLRLFGWAIDGDIDEPSAYVAEGYSWENARLFWDHDQR